MKKLLLAVCLGFVFMAWGCATAPQGELEYKNFLVHYDGLKDKKPIFKAIEKTNAEVIYDYENFSTMAVKVPLKKSAEKIQAYFEKVDGVVYVQPDQIELMH